MKINKKIIISIFVFFIITLLSISIIIANNTNTKNLEVNKEKIQYQIRYLDNEILDMSNFLYNSNWEGLQISLIEIYNYWNSAILDLNNLNIDNNYLTDFGKILDNLSISIRNQEKSSSLNSLLEIYNLLIIYSQSLNYDEIYTNIILAKYNLLVAVSIVDTGNWTLTHESILKSDNYISNVVNSMEVGEYNQYNINQAYIAIKELENLINVKDFELFYFKYDIAMGKLQNL